MHTSSVITPALKHELQTLFKLEQCLFGEHCYPDFFFRQAFDCWPDGLLVARNEQQQIMGYVLVAPAQSAHEHSAWILSLAVAPEHQRKGVAHSLLLHALEHFSHIQSLCLTVHPHNPALALYQKLGFIEVEHEDDYFGENEPRIKMQYRP